MSTIKRKLLRAAYEAEGFDWQSIYLFVDDKGFLELDILPSYNEENFHSFVPGSIRPKSLDGFENNNGWQRINTSKSLPKSSCFCRIILVTGKETFAEFNKSSKEFNVIGLGHLCFKRVSHYIEADNQKKPYW